MARYILTFGTDRIAGSRGGSTFQKSGSQFVIRKRNVPVQKFSEKQTAKQNQFASIQQNWRELSMGEKDTFTTAAPSYTRINSLGIPYNLSGQQLQASSNINLNENNIPQITSIAAASPFPVITDSFLICNVGFSLLSIQFNPTIVPAGVSLQLFVSRPISQGKEIKTVKDLVLMVTWPQGQVQGGNLFNMYVQRFGQLNNSPGQQITAWGRYLQMSTGQVGPFSKVSANIN